MRTSKSIEADSNQGELPVKAIKLSSLALVGAAMAIVACDSTNVPQQVSDATIQNDIASSSGDAAASVLSGMLSSESSSGLAVKAPLTSSVTGSGADVAWSVTKTCYDANNVVVNNCQPLSSVRKVVAHATANGANSGTSTTSGGATINWTGVAHRVLDDTVQRNFNTAQPPVEQSRTHNAQATAHDTATFTDAAAGASRVIAADAVDSVKAVTWNLPHSSNPWPVSGVMKRVGTVHVVATQADQTFERTVNVTIEIDFPPDAQGNVVLKVNDKTCNLNLFTRAVTECH
jgi:hypothetical protein